MTTNGWVLYDQECGVCSRWVPFWAPTLLRTGLETAPLQADWVQERTGLPLELLLQDIRVLLKDGTLYSGAEAYFYCMRRVWWSRPFHYAFQLPGLNAAFRASYRAFARNRFRISKTCRLRPAGRHREQTCDVSIR